MLLLVRLGALKLLLQYFGALHCAAYPASIFANVMGRSSLSLPHTRLGWLPPSLWLYRDDSGAACIQQPASLPALPPPHNRTKERTNERTLVHCPSFDEIAFSAAAAAPAPPRLPICRPNEKRSTAALRSFISWFILSLSLSLSLVLLSIFRRRRRRQRRDDTMLPLLLPPRDD